METSTFFWVLGGACTIIGALVIVIYNSIAGKLDKLSDFVMGPESKVVAYGKCVATMADVREEINVERLERKSDVAGLQKQLNDHIQAV
jgi:hypothetical protein